MSTTQVESIVDGILRTIPPANTRGNVLRAEICAVVAECLDLIGGARESDARAALHPAAARWATTGVPIGTVHRLIRAGFRLHLDDRTAKSPAHKVDHLMDAMQTINATVSTAYLEVMQSPLELDGQAVTRALLSGRHAAMVARERGTPLADRYSVLSVSADRDAFSPSHFLEMLARRFGPSVSALHSALGGTILIPGSPDLEEFRDLIVQASLTVIAIEAQRDAIPSATADGHELLDVVHRLHRPPGLYHFGDLAIEYQLTRPGPGRDRLETALDAVAEQPDLIDTLRAHLDNGLNRRLTAREMHIHQNTVDYRLKRIYRLAGLHQHDPGLIWKMRAALTVREYMQAGNSGTEQLSGEQ
ncbi:PucR family transcriptional regulator [Nocardia sp. NPDC058658]|uniref:PucR family transcriptional regulator n=1 Tax=Nocardia sp. NPDC058658 TaxID=3346580 RepID=UPI003664D824